MANEELINIVTSLSDAIGEVYCGYSTTTIDGHYTEYVTRDDLLCFRNDLAGAVEQVLRSFIERKPND